MKKTFNVLFILLVLADLVALQFLNMPEIRYFTKPAIVGSLIVLLLGKHFRKKRLKNAMLGALLFSIVGDLLLLFTDNGELFFLLGLLSFLMAHAFYILAFVHRGYFDKAPMPWGILFILAYALSVYWYIAEGLDYQQPYVVAYMLILVLLAFVALFRKSYVSKRSYQWVLAGALFFMLSDSVLAVNAFKTAIPYAGIAIMLTYALAQWFLVHGAIEQDKTEPA